MSAPPRVAAFMFHDVTEDPTSSGFQNQGALPYTHTPQAFVRCLDEIAAGPAPPVLVTEVDLAKPGRHIVLTFDDGGKSALQVGEELARRGWKGHFFIVTSLIGSHTFLDKSEIRALRNAGHLIGSHSHTHPHIFRDLGPRQMAEEWRTSCDVLAQLLGEPILSASVPGGDISSQTLESASAGGLRYLFTSEPWLAPRRRETCWILGRFSAKRWTSPARIHELAQFRGWTSALMQRRLKVWASMALPSLYRRYVNARTRPSA